MKRNNINLAKELLIFMALLIIIMLIIAVSLYDFIPANINILEPISYSSDSTTTNIKQEIAYTNSGDSTADASSNNNEKSDEELVAALKSYTINASELAMYGQKNLYNSGNSNPFDYADDTQVAAGDSNSSSGTDNTTTDGSSNGTDNSSTDSGSTTTGGTTTGGSTSGGTASGGTSAGGTTSGGTTGGTSTGGTVSGGETTVGGASGSGNGKSGTQTTTPTGTFFERANSK